LCGYAQRDLAVPLLTEAAITGTGVDVRAASVAATAWCAEVNALVHSEIMAVPDERLVIERELLRPLPSLRLQIGAPSVIRKVDRLSCIWYASARYSVPTRLIGASVAVVLDHGAVCIVEPATAMIVAQHELAAPGTASICDAHYDGPRPALSRGPRPKTITEQQFCALGEDAQAFLVGAAAIGNTRLGSELEILLGLGAAHGEDALLAALRCAVAFKRFPPTCAPSAAGSNDEHLYPDPDGFVVDTPMGRYTGVKEMIEMSKTPGEYTYPLTPLGSWQPSWLSDKAGTNGAPRPRTDRNICEVCERALARTDTGMCDFCTVKQQRRAGGVA
jgi:hypothetical protein